MTCTVLKLEWRKVTDDSESKVRHSIHLNEESMSNFLATEQQSYRTMGFLPTNHFDTFEVNDELVTFLRKHHGMWLEEKD